MLWEVRRLGLLVSRFGGWGTGTVLGGLKLFLGLREMGSRTRIKGLRFGALGFRV